MSLITKITKLAEENKRLIAEGRSMLHLLGVLAMRREGELIITYDEINALPKASPVSFEQLAAALVVRCKPVWGLSDPKEESPNGEAGETKTSGGEDSPSP